MSFYKFKCKGKVVKAESPLYVCWHANITSDVISSRVFSRLFGDPPSNATLPIDLLQSRVFDNGYAHEALSSIATSRYPRVHLLATEASHVMFHHKNAQGSEREIEASRRACVIDSWKLEVLKFMADGLIDYLGDCKWATYTPICHLTMRSSLSTLCLRYAGCCSRIPTGWHRGKKLHTHAVGSHDLCCLRSSCHCGGDVSHHEIWRSPRARVLENAVL